ncbi:hypothetical protein Tco_1289927, partial [Tanacetum coccineum]
EVALMIKATSKDRDQSYIIYNGNAGADRMHANLVDADTERRIMDKEKELRESESSNDVSRWTFECDEGFFELIVKCVHQARRG